MKKAYLLTAVIILSLALCSCKKTSETEETTPLYHRDHYNLSDNQMTLFLYDYTPDMDLSFVTEFTKLRTVTIIDCELKNLDFLKNCKSLRTITASGIGLEDISALAGIETLFELDLSDNNITDISALYSSINITECDLHGNKIEDISPLVNNTSMLNLDLSDNKIKDASPLAGMRSLNQLNLSKNAELKKLGELDTFNYLDIDLSGCVSLTPSEILTLPGCSKLINLNLDGIPLDSCDSLGQLEGVQTLSLKGCRLDDIGLISGLSRLSFLDISNNNLRNLFGLADEIPSLLYLYLCENMSLADLGGIENFPSLVRLNLTCCGSLNPRCLGVLSQFSGLKYLTLDGVPLSSLSFVSELNNLKSLSLRGCSLFDISGLSSLPGSVTGLDLTANGISDLSPLSSAAISNIDIGYNKISDITALLSIETLTHVSFGIADKTLPWVPEELNQNKISEEQLISLGLICDVYDFDSGSFLFTVKR